MSTNPESRAWLTVRGDALRRNYARVRASVGSQTRIVPMVKADAYGLGVAEVIRALGGEGPWGWGVATVDEGIRIRELGVEDPVIVLCPVTEDVLEAALGERLQLSLSSLEALADVARVSRRLGTVAEVHVDVDTGMGRTGFDWRAAAEWLPRVEAAARDEVRWVGLQTHLHSADESEGSIREQWERLEEVLELVQAPPQGLMVHVLNSSGVFRTPDYSLAAVRPGIFLYGGEIGMDLPGPDLVVSLQARVIHVREAQPGTTLGYGATYEATKPERWATLAIGYGDGLPRALGNRGDAILDGVRVPIIGRISMDLTVVDITDSPGVRVGDVATLLGKEGREEITVDDVAALAGTISYEVLTGFTPRLPRVWTGLT